LNKNGIAMMRCWIKKIQENNQLTEIESSGWKEHMLGMRSLFRRREELAASEPD
jgi:hypothetical protein